MRVLTDANILLWMLDRETFGADRLSAAAIAMVDDWDVEIVFSVVNVWEIAIKFALDRPKFRIDPMVVWNGALAAGLSELVIRGEHAIAVRDLPHLHRAPSTFC